MTTPAEHSLSTLNCKVLVTAGDVHVAIMDDVLPQFEALDDKMGGRFQRIMEMWCQGHRLTPEMFNYNEGRSPNKNRMIQAFKGFKIRFYGIDIRAREGRSFVILAHDPAKKKDKADPKILRRAKDRADLI